MEQIAKLWRGEIHSARTIWIWGLLGYLAFLLLFVIGHIVYFQTGSRFGQVISMAVGVTWTGLMIVATWRSADMSAGVRNLKILARALCAVATVASIYVLAALLARSEPVTRIAFPTQISDFTPTAPKL
jgi:hypothetical protein